MNWEMKTLGEIGEWGSGGTPFSSQSEYYNGTIPWLIIEDLNDSVVTTSQKTITELGLKNSSAKIVEPGTLLIAMYGSIGKLGIAGMQCATNQAIAFCHSNSALIDVNFLFYYFLFSREKLLDMGRGNTQQNIGQAVLKEFPIPLPTLPEQRRIAALLQRADHLRRMQRYADGLSASLLQSVFLEMFGDKLKSNSPKVFMGELVTITGGGTPSRDVPEYFEGKIAWLTSKDMHGEYIFDTLEHITEDAIKKSSTKLVPVGSILIVVKSKILMRRVPLAITKIPLCHGQDIKSIQCSKKVNAHFLLQVIRLSEDKLMFQARGANTEGLTLPMLNEIQVPIIPLPEQERFAGVVRRVEALRRRQAEADRQAEELFQSLLAKSFGQR